MHLKNCTYRMEFFFENFMIIPFNCKGIFGRVKDNYESQKSLCQSFEKVHVLSRQSGQMTFVGLTLYLHFNEFT